MELPRTVVVCRSTLPTTLSPDSPHWLAVREPCNPSPLPEGEGDGQGLAGAHFEHDVLTGKVGQVDVILVDELAQRLVLLGRLGLLRHVRSIVEQPSNAVSCRSRSCTALRRCTT